MGENYGVRSFSRISVIFGKEIIFGAKISSIFLEPSAGNSGTAWSGFGREYCDSQCVGGKTEKGFCYSIQVNVTLIEPQYISNITRT